MIAHLTGLVLFRGSNYVILDVGGVGYKMYLSADAASALPRIGERCSLYTHLHVRENALDLYGFRGQAEIEFFEMLMGVPGIGPKSALGIVSMAPIDMLKRAIASGEVAYLTKVSGIGRKTAEKIVVELRGKLGGTGDIKLGSEETDVLDALVSLGYSVREAREAVRKVSGVVGSLDEKIRNALRFLGS